LRGGAKGEAATSSAIAKSGFDQDSAVVEDALTMKTADVKSEFEDIKSRQTDSDANIINEEYKLKRQIASTQQSINDLTENYVNTSK
jgi:hypothetical protein